VDVVVGPGLRVGRHPRSVTLRVAGASFGVAGTLEESAVGLVGVVPVGAVERASADENGLAGGLAVGAERDQRKDLRSKLPDTVQD